MKLKKLLLTLMLPISLISIVYADYQDGLDAALEGDYKAALKIFQPLAEQGDINAQYALGWMYDDGRGLSEDDKLAVKWYRRAAEKGHIDAQYNLGHMYRRGDGIEKDYKQALKWYKKSAKQGNKKALEVIKILNSK